MNIEKLKGEIKRGMILTTVLVALSPISGCKSNTSFSSREKTNFKRKVDLINEGYYFVSKEDTGIFEKITKEIISNGKMETGYKSENIFITIDKDTYEKSIFIYYKYNKHENTFDFESGYCLTEWPTNGINYYPIYCNDEKIHRNKYEVFLNELDSYLDNFQPKSYYTKQEIYDLADLLSDAIKQSNKQSNISLKLK